MSYQKVKLNSFKGGQISPRLQGRIDLDFYVHSCSKLENFLVFSHGGTYERPGTYYIATAQDSENDVRVIDFKYSNEQTYIIELGHRYARFYTEGGIILTDVATTSGTIEQVYAITTPWDGDDVFEISYAQTADTIIMVHPDYPPYKLIRNAHDDWDLEKMVYDPPARLDWNTEETLTLSGSAATGTISLTASSSVFNNLHVGAHFFIRGDVKVEGWFSAENMFTDAIQVDIGDDVELLLGGTISGSTMTLQVSTDGTEWQDHINFLYSQTLNFTEAYRDKVYYRAGIKTGNYKTGTLHVILSRKNEVGYVELTSISSPTVASGIVIKELPSIIATDDWAEGAWSEYRGYPSCFTFHKQRGIYAGTYLNPQSMWGTKLDDYNDFEYGKSNADDAFMFTIDSDDVNKLLWMYPSRVLLGGTSGGEWKLSKLDSAITPTTPSVDKQTTYGSAQIRAMQVGNYVVYVQAGGHKMRAMSYNFDLDGYVSEEISVRSENLLREGSVVDWCFQKKPDNIIYTVMSEGHIVASTYDPANQTIAFSKITTTSGNFKSIACIPGDEYDEVWAVVERTINGTTYKYIEQMQSPYWDEQTEYIMMDSALTYTGTPKADIYGLSHLEGQEVSVLVDGAAHINCTVVSGAITLQPEFIGIGTTSVVHVGLPYTGIIKTNRIFSSTETGLSIGRQAVIYDVNIDFNQSFTCKLGLDEESATQLPVFEYPSLSSAPVPFTGQYTVNFGSGAADELYITIMNDKPLPLQVLGIAATVYAAPR